MAFSDDNDFKLNSEENIKSAEKCEKSRKIRSALLFVLCLFLAFGIGKYIQQNVIIKVNVNQTSMLSTLSDGDTVYISAWGSVDQFDVVVFYDPEIRDYWLIKRVVGVEGQTVEIADGILYITEDGITTAYSENYVYGDNITLEKTTVGKGELLVLGDNRTASYDSSEFGVINKSAVVGVALFLPSEKAVEIS